MITDQGYRLESEKYIDDKSQDWLFLPGGLGFGSEYFKPLINLLDLSHNVWRLDFPDDGSNRLELGEQNYTSLWRSGLINVMKSRQKPVLVTHSVSAMLALTVPELEQYLSGLVILSSSPSSIWRAGVPERAKLYKLDSLEEYAQEYQKEKTDAAFKKFFLSILDYYVKPNCKNKALEQLSSLQYHCKRYEWLAQYFHDNKYEATWIPSTIPTLILGSTDDIVTPIHLFKQDTRFNRKNIQIIDICDAGHFPWIEQPDLVKEAMWQFSKVL